MEYDIETLIKALQDLKARADRLGAVGVTVYAGHKDGSGLDYEPGKYDGWDKRLIVEGLVTENGQGNVNARIGSITVRMGDEDGVAVVED
jgi:hypothetical protein